MPVLNDDIINIYLGNSDVIAVHDYNDIIWPVNYEFALVSEWQIYGNYTLLTVPASGGNAFATWKVAATARGQTRYVTVTPTTVSISDSTNFSYDVSTGQWHANDRESNGYTSSSIAPTEAQMYAEARSCTLDASYVGTVVINGKTYSVNLDADTVTMTQNRNYGNYVYANNVYGTVTMDLDDFYDSAHEAGAGYADTTASASCDCDYYIEWDSTAHEYYYSEVYEWDFVYTTPENWVTIVGSAISVDSRGRDEGPQRTATITARPDPSVHPYASGYDSMDLYQKANVQLPMPASCSALEITPFKIGGSTVSYIYNHGQTEVSVTPVATWTEAGTKYTAYDDGDRTACYPGLQHTNESVTLSTVLNVYGADSTTNSTFTVTNDYNENDATWTVIATYLDAEITRYIDQAQDTYTTTSVPEYTVSISVESGSITAAGGSLTIDYSASHFLHYTQIWSDGVTIKAQWDGDIIDDTARAVPIAETDGPSGYNNRFSSITNGVLTHYSMQNIEGTDTVYFTIRHPDDIQTTDYTETYSAENEMTYGNIIWSVSSQSHSSAYVAPSQDTVDFSVSCSRAWTSGYPVSSLVTTDFVITIDSKANDGYRTYNLWSDNLQLGSLEDFERSEGTTVLSATHIDAGSETVDLTEMENYSDGGVVISDVPGQKIYDPNTTYNYDYTNTNVSITLSDYWSAQNPAPSDADTYYAILFYSSNGHREQEIYRWTIEHDIVTRYTYDSLYVDDVESTYIEDGYDTGSWTNVSDTPDISTSENWLTVSGNDITVTANDGAARSCVITAYVERLDGQADITNSVTFYQQKAVSISVSETSLIFSVLGGTQTFDVTYANTTFTITHNSVGGTDPVYSIQPSSGGSSTGVGTTTITVTVHETSSQSRLQGEITVSPGDQSLSDITIDVQQDAYYPGELTSTAEAYWDSPSSGTLSYFWTLYNSSNKSKIANIRAYVRVLNYWTDDPGEIEGGALAATIFITGIKTIPANGSLSSSSWQSQNIYGRDPNKYYYISVQGINGTSINYTWTEITNSAN